MIGSKRFSEDVVMGRFASMRKSEEVKQAMSYDIHDIGVFRLERIRHD